ncbi:M81 family metallopeptidase [Paracoccus sp. PS-1]|uniref:M81 family metallopeptidase n=1 Tax=unclassified Paracoccus (in: a-proteobacteria) TaxID=2688777 RepID=UPI00048B32D7|nr:MULTISPECIES: M81 family metallopeptidase [unclassified Paracoccus (in: a-proteobacteria)]MDQ7263446.1 M81 family metallopeptidase [Paracoccus sp. PS1]
MTRLVLARLNHETNSFSPVKTPLAAFAPKWGEEALAAAGNYPAAIGAFHAFARRIGAAVEVPLIAHAMPSGPVEDEAFEAMAQAILAAVEKGCDGILLDLHGAMVTRSHDDGEGELLRRVRAAAPGVPIGVALDLHGNITQAMLEHCDVIVGFKTYPHVDMVETGEHVLRLFQPLLSGAARPAMALCHPPMLAATLCMNTTTDCAMTDLIALARQAEARPGVQAVTVFGGFPIADLAETGLSIVTVADTPELAREVARELGREAWRRRAEYVYAEEPLAQSIARAAALADGSAPVLLLDHGDNCMSGGSCDVMDVLEALLAADHDGIMVGPIADPETVARLFAAGEGAEAEIRLGNKTPAEGLPAPRPPLRLTGRVAALSDGRYRVSGPIYHGQELSMGRAAAFDTGAARIVICEQPHEPLDLGCFSCVGLDAAQARFLHLKSRMYCRPVFEPLAQAVVECASSGVTASDYDLFAFKKLARPIYPLDPGTIWQG